MLVLLRIPVPAAAAAVGDADEMGSRKGYLFALARSCELSAACCFSCLLRLLNGWLSLSKGCCCAVCYYCFGSGFSMARSLGRILLTFLRLAFSRVLGVSCGSEDNFYGRWLVVLEAPPP